MLFYMNDNLSGPTKAVIEVFTIRGACYKRFHSIRTYMCVASKPCLAHVLHAAHQSQEDLRNE